MTELTALRTENGKLFDAGKDAKTGRPSYTLEARTGPAHYKDAYRDTDPWLDLDESYFEEGREGLVYPKLPNIVTVFRDRCGYQIQSRSNPDHVARVELVSIDGLPVTTWQDSKALKTSVRVHPYRTGIWKDFSGASKAKSTTMRWKVTELGNAAKDSHPFAFRESPEAYSTADLTALDPVSMEQAKVTIETARTRIDDQSWYWDELIPARAKLVDTDWQVGAVADNTHVYGASFINNIGHGIVGQHSSGNYRHVSSRFTNITILAGSTITSCTVTYRTNYNGSGSAVNVKECFADHDNASSPTSNAEFYDATKTSGAASEHSVHLANVTWYGTQLSSELQKITNRVGWASGNAVVLYTMDNGSSTYSYNSVTFYKGSSTYCPKLTVTWIPPGQAASRGINSPNVSWLSKSLLKRREI